MRVLLFAVLLAAGLAAPAAAQSQSQDSTLLSAERAARAWIARLDAAQLDSAWQDVAGVMRGSTTYEEWATSLRSLRGVLPPRAHRTLLHAEHSVPLFGGASVLMTFRVGRSTLREIVVMVRERTSWRVGGYGVLM